MKCFKFEFLRLIKDKKLYISLGIGLLVSILQLISCVCSDIAYEKYVEKSYETIKDFYFPNSVFNTYIGLDSGIYSTVLLYIFPILAVIPFGCSFFDDKKSGYIKILYTSVERNKYLISKFLIVFLCGFMVTFFVLGSSLFLTSMFFPAINPEPVSMIYGAIGKEYLWNDIYCNNPYLYTILFIIIDAVFMGILNTVSLALSSFVNNKFAAMFGPTLFYIGISYILSCVNFPQWSPINFLSANQFVPCNLINVVVFSVILLVSSFVMFVVGEKKDVF